MAVAVGRYGGGQIPPAPPRASHGLYEMARPRRSPMQPPQHRPPRRARPGPAPALLAAAAALALAAHLAAAPDADAAFAYEMSPSLPMDKSLPAGGCAESRFVVSERDILAIPPGGMTVAFELAGEAAEFIELDPPSLALTDDMPRQYTTLRIEVPQGTPEGSYAGSITAAKQESATQTIKLKRSFTVNVTAGPPPEEGAPCVPPTATRAPDPPPAPPDAEGGGPEEGGGCLIATAAYGTETAPQVQRLRELRDLPPFASGPGRDLVSGINSVYYTFSPAVADLERDSPALREAVRLLVAPAAVTAAAAGSAAHGGEWGAGGYDDGDDAWLQYGIVAFVLFLAGLACITAFAPGPGEGRGGARGERIRIRRRRRGSGCGCGGAAGRPRSAAFRAAPGAAPGAAPARR